MLSKQKSQQEIFGENLMKKIKLSREEKIIENDFEKYKPVSKSSKKHIEKIIEGSRKSHPISFRINENDLKKLKKKADKTGLPYQTMLNVVIHKFVTDSYLDKEEIDKYIQLRKTG
jgi:predicted DNA binding CopG/RHH family protein